MTCWSLHPPPLKPFPLLIRSHPHQRLSSPHRKTISQIQQLPANHSALLPVLLTGKRQSCLLLLRNKRQSCLLLLRNNLLSQMRPDLTIPHLCYKMQRMNLSHRMTSHSYILLRLRPHVTLQHNIPIYQIPHNNHNYLSLLPLTEAVCC